MRFDQENHDAVGIKCDPAYDYKDTGYCFIESTAPNIITDSYGEYRNAGKLISIPKVIEISSGKLYNAEDDYKDALRYKELSNSHSNPKDYQEWISLRKKYGLEEKECDSSYILCNGECWAGCDAYHTFHCYSTGGLCESNPTNCPSGTTPCNNKCFTTCERGTFQCTPQGATCLIKN